MDLCWTSLIRRKAKVRRFRVQVLAKTILVVEVRLQTRIVVLIGAAEHKTSQKFITTLLDCNETFCICRIVGVLNYLLYCKVLEFRSQKHWGYYNCIDTSICLEGLDMRTKFLIVLVIVIGVMLIISEETLMRCNSGHYTLCLSVVQAA